MGFSNGSIACTVGSTAGKVDWIVIAKGPLGTEISTDVLTTGNGNDTIEQALVWHKSVVRLDRNTRAVYDHTLEKKSVLKDDLSIEEFTNIILEKGYSISGNDFAVEK